MGVRERREREKAELRQTIMDAARRIFVEEGYENVSMRRIADAIEYSPTAIYVHFKDKAALFSEIMRQDFDRLASRFGKVARATDPVERIRTLGLEYIRFGVEHPHHYRLMFMTPPALDDPKLRQQVEARQQHRGDPSHDAYALLRLAVVEALTAGRFRPELTDPELISQTLWAGVHGVTALEITKHDDPGLRWRPIKQRATLMVEALLRGVLPPSSK
jgi:AcrR family transcriptional regulator